MATVDRLASYPPNPNPSRITDAIWRLRCECLELEPGTGDKDGGIYAAKPGYHNTRAANASDDYSVREAPDKLGPSDKAAGWDWTFASAQGGDFRRMDFYGERLQRAWETRDPRCNPLREVLGQTDTDTAPEGLDFRHHTTRVPDYSHSWHWHFSITRAYANNWPALAGIYSVLAGQSMDAYLADGGRLFTIDGTGEIDMPLTKEDIRLIADEVWSRDVDPDPAKTTAAYRVLDAAQKAAEATLVVAEANGAKLDELIELVRDLQPGPNAAATLEVVLNATGMMTLTETGSAVAGTP